MNKSSLPADLEISPIFPHHLGEFPLMFEGVFCMCFCGGTFLGFVSRATNSSPLPPAYPSCGRDSGGSRARQVQLQRMLDEDPRLVEVVSSPAPWGLSGVGGGGGQGCRRGQQLGGSRAVLEALVVGFPCSPLKVKLVAGDLRTAQSGDWVCGRQAPACAFFFSSSLQHVFFDLRDV